MKCLFLLSPLLCGISALAQGTGDPSNIGQGLPTTPNPRVQGDPTAPGAPSAGPNQRQSPSALPQGTTREQMWFAPTAEDWKKPVLIPFQRSFEDAQAVAKETNKPILIVVNMDGEIASEHYAGVRYRQPEIAKLYEPYICVIASVYRHNPRDYDEQGNRILCPRFGSVTCGEHIAIEPALYDKYFEGKRIAPRHIMVEHQKEEVYDVYYAWDTDTVFNTVRDGIELREEKPNPPITDRPLLDRVASRAAEDRIFVEQTYRTADRETRRSILSRAAAIGGDTPLEVLRLALFGLDPDLARMARRALAQSTQEGAIELIVEALRVPLDAEEQQQLVAALVRLGQSFPRAQTLAAVYQGLDGRQGAVNADAWSKALAAAGPFSLRSARAAVEYRLDMSSQALGAQPKDPKPRLDYAEAMLELALDPGTEKRLAKAFLQDARDAALQGEALGGTGWAVHSVLAVSEHELGSKEAAMQRAEAALASLPQDASSKNALFVLQLFAQGRQRQILESVRAKREWPSTWLSDVHNTYGLIARHPLGSDVDIVAHYDFLRALGAGGPSARIVEEGLTRYPDSWLLHDRQRARLLSERGTKALAEYYAQRVAASGATPAQVWYAGYAALVEAEYDKRGGKDVEAIEAYTRAIELFEASIARNPESRANSDHYIALCLAGRARIRMEQGELDAALDGLLQSLERRPEAAAFLDGLNLSPVDTGKQLRVKLREAKREDAAARIDAAFAKLDPAQLELPAYETLTPDDGQGRRGLRRQRR